MPGVFFNTSKAELPAKVELFFGKNTVLPFTIRTDGVCFHLSQVYRQEVYLQIGV